MRILCGTILAAAVSVAAAANAETSGGRALVDYVDPFIGTAGSGITREMAIGRRRLDIGIEYGKGRYAVELKMKRQFGPDSLSQLAGYLSDLGLDEGWLAVFDDDPGKSWDEKIFNRDETFGGKTIHVVGL